MDNIKNTAETVANDNDSAAENRKIRLRVLTPSRTIYDKPVSMVVARTVDGDLGVLYGHEPRAALMGNGMLRVFPDGNKEDKDESMMVVGGIITVRDNEAVVLSEIAEHPGKLQAFLDKLDAERAANKVNDKTTELHTRRMETAIRQALVRQDVSAYTMIKHSGEQPEK